MWQQRIDRPGATSVEDTGWESMDRPICVDEAGTSLRERFDPRRLRRESWRRRREAVPFWLSSLVLHLVCFLLIASFTTPWSGRGAAGSRGISLIISFGDAEQSRGQETIVVPAQTPTRAETSEQEPALAPRPLPEQQKPSAKQAAQPPRRSPAAAESSPTVPERAAASPFRRWMDAAMASSDFGRQPSRYEVFLNRNRTSPKPPVVAQPLRALTVDDDGPRDTSDQVVDDFIAYDIGQLRGLAGQQAHRRFMAMGAEGVPAVVRGLNKAAQLHASCPVGVLAGKLISLLRRVQDPSLSQYAIDNLGRGVPTNAPHYQRIIALRDRWLRDLGGGTEGAAQLVAQHGLQQDGELVELVLALTDAPGETLLVALQSGDDRLRDAALLALIQSRHPLSDHPRRGIIRELTMLSSESSPNSLRSLARNAMQAVRRPAR